jgi:Putative endonuclease segE, GIY-YIG domain
MKIDFWTYNGKVFGELDIPEGAIGFIYLMTAIIDGKSVAYIGKKNFFANIKRPLGKKALAVTTDKRLKKYTRVIKPDFLNYYSSNAILKKAHKEGVAIKREILMICYSGMELTYQETKHQFVYEVLEKEEFLNGNILGRFYKTK